MPELRKSPTSGTWVVIATERGKRPHDFSTRPENRDGKRDDRCPFCYGNERMTPPELLALGREGEEADSPGWSVRVVPNKFPALSLEGKGLEAPDIAPGLYRHIPGIGAHEVLIESPDHSATFGSHTVRQLGLIIEATILRAQALQRDRRLSYFQFFKNQGRSAGASLQHAHCQIIVTPIIPSVVREELLVARAYHQEEGGCVYCQMIDAEMEDGERLIEALQDFAIINPYASRFPYETWILPRFHSPSFHDMDEAQKDGLALALKRSIGRLETAFGLLPYNLVLHTSPWEEGHEAYYHWHIEILPRLTIIAGFELGTGYYINPTAPELAAATLREIQTDEEEVNLHETTRV